MPPCLHDSNFRSDWLRREGIQPGKASLVRVRGDSMEPTLRDGAMVLVDPQIVRISMP
ncbi:MAG: S24 family peptidase [Gemmobacter sp.]|jgi:phage repressor protein C with HTH and peptisase S24 domain|nr:S24 family peptidase [Gemmobacter sp.]